MTVPIIKLSRKITIGGSLLSGTYEFANSFSTTTSNCSITTGGELSVAQNVATVSLKATFTAGTTGTAYLAVKDKGTASTIKPTDLTGWTIVGSGATITSNVATFTLSMNDNNGITTGVGICAYTIKSNLVSSVVQGNTFTSIS